MITETKYNFLVQQYKDMIYSYSFYFLKNRMDADDVTQEVLVKIWKNLGEFKILVAKSWIMKTTHNLCIDYLRKRSSDLVKNPFSIEDVSEFIENRKDKNPMLEAENNIIGEKIKEAISLLPEILRSIFVLYEIQGMKYKEISKTLEMPINSVKVYLMRARKQLQIFLIEIKHQEVV